MMIDHKIMNMDGHMLPAIVFCICKPSKQRYSNNLEINSPHNSWKDIIFMLLYSSQIHQTYATNVHLHIQLDTNLNHQ